MDELAEASKQDKSIGRRPCEVSSNGYFARGWWHCFYRSGDRLYALVEHENGAVQSHEISGCYSIKFTDQR